MGKDLKFYEHLREKASLTPSPRNNYSQYNQDKCLHFTWFESIY